MRKFLGLLVASLACSLPHFASADSLDFVGTGNFSNTRIAGKLADGFSWSIRLPLISITDITTGKTETIEHGSIIVFLEHLDKCEHNALCFKDGYIAIRVNGATIFQDNELKGEVEDGVLFVNATGEKSATSVLVGNGIYSSTTLASGTLPVETPEVGSMLLLGMGLIGIGFIRKQIQ